MWCQDNNLSLNVIKTKEMIVDYRKRRTEHAPILLDWAVVEQVESFKFLDVHITNKNNMVQALQDGREEGTKNLFPLRRMKRFGMGPQIHHREPPD